MLSVPVAPMESTAPVPARDPALEAFYAGDRRTLEACYRDHYGIVADAVGRVLHGIDRETVIHEVFFRVLTERDFRESFRGPHMRPWLATVARNQAIDFLRRQGRGVPLERAPEPEPGGRDLDAELDAKALIQRFREEALPGKWQAVFEARFLKQLDQREAAAELGMHRTTLAYQELRIRQLLKRFLLRMEQP